MIGDTPLKVRDGFDNGLAKATLADAKEVISLIWVCILSRFPTIIPSLKRDPHVFMAFPQARALIDSPGG